jgi:PQQ-dependent dehydrogenase (methanol/ethanol family)
VLAALAVASLVLVLSAPAANRANSVAVPPAFTPSESTALPGDNWIGYNGNVWNQRFSTLNQIDTSNVKNLKLAFQSKLVIPGVKIAAGAFGILSEQTPVEYNGVLYMPDANNRVWAINATTGERLWVHVPHPLKGFNRAVAGINGFPERGVAIGDGKVYVGDGDATISALDAATGRVVWKKIFGDWHQAYFFSAAMTYFDGVLYTGQSGGDGGAACKMLAIDAKTGKLLWEFKTIPLSPSDPGYNTWPKHKAYAGGGAMWNTPVVDPSLGLVYVGVGNPIPYSGLKRLPGSEQFTENILALHMKTGKLAWHFQTVHHDIWDYDVTNPLVLYDMKYKGVMRHAIVHAGKTGFLYILDRKTGKPILGINEKPVPQSAEMHTWPTQPFPVGQAFSRQCASAEEFAGVTGKGDNKPVIPGCIFAAYGTDRTTVVYPSALGGADWPPTSFSPQTGDLYICANNVPNYLKSVPVGKQILKPQGDFGQLDGGPVQAGAVPPEGLLVAMNLSDNRIAWSDSLGKGASNMCYSGTASTAGGVTFVGRTNDHLEAYDSRNGKLLWRSPKLGGGANAAPMVYSDNGNEYVAIYAGGNGLLSFASAKFKPDPGVTLYVFKLPS